MTKYFETKFKPPFKRGEEVTVYCKATQQGDTWNICMVHTDSQTPFVIIQPNVTENFFNGVEEITKSFYVAQLQWVGNIAS